MTKSSSRPRVVVSNNGPYLVSGDVPLAKQTIVTDGEGESQQWRQGDAFPAQDSYQLCRCGKSKTKPFCDGTMRRSVSTAPKPPPHDVSRAGAGPGRSCARAHGRAGAVCGRALLRSERTGVEPGRAYRGRRAADDFPAAVNNCPSGRLVAWDRATGKPIEHALPVSIGLIEDPSQGVSGPLWLRGGIALLAADGFAYEIRNRMTLCRCGASSNKPFCDGSHVSSGFRDWT